MHASAAVQHCSTSPSICSQLQAVTWVLNADVGLHYTALHILHTFHVCMVSAAAGITLSPDSSAASSAGLSGAANSRLA